MQEELLRQFYLKRGYDQDTADQAVAAVQELAGFLQQSGSGLESATVELVSEHVAGLVKSGRNTMERLRALARYFYLTGAQAAYIYFTALFGSQGVMESIRGRIGESEGEAAATAIFGVIDQPPLGAPLADLPPFTQKVMARLAECLPPDKYCTLLAGNNHGLARESQAEEKQYLAAAGSLDAYLLDLHRRNVAELQTFCDQGKTWCEQVITQEVVDYVRDNPEVMSAVRVGNRLYITKIPYDTAAFLHATDPARRKYFLCHCPFVREAFREEKTTINPNWCYCSGGFTKFPFEVLFNCQLAVELLESPLLGHERCRFAITLPENLPVAW